MFLQYSMFEIARSTYFRHALFAKVRLDSLHALLLFYVEGAAAVAVAAANAVCGIALLCSFFGVPHRAAAQFRPLLLFGILPFLIIAYNLKSGLSQEHFLRCWGYRDG